MMYTVQKKLLQPINTSLASLLGFYKILLGIWLLLPFDTLNDAHLNIPGYLDKSMIAVITLFIGSLMLTSTIIGKYKPLVVSSVIGFYYWFIAAGWMFYADTIGFSWITALIVSIYCGFIYVNLKVNKNHYIQ